MIDNVQGPAPDPAEMSRVFGPGRLVPLQHPNQRNKTWLLQPEQQDKTPVVLKRYCQASSERVSSILEIEERARLVEVPVPPVLWRSSDGRLVAYACAAGTPGVPDQIQYMHDAATMFVRQLHGFRGFKPKFAPVRPLLLPRRADEAVRYSHDARIVQAIAESWDRLGQWALQTPTTASHVDWRADNILCSRNGVSAVVDWEDTVLLPAAEAVGYAAASLTHSWREGLYRPLTPEPLVRFLDKVASLVGWSHGSEAMQHARLAAFYTAAVRLAEDQRRGRAAVSLTQVQSTIYW